MPIKRVSLSCCNRDHHWCCVLEILYVSLLCIRLKYPVVWRLSQMTFTFQWKWLVVTWSLSLY